MNRFAPQIRKANPREQAEAIGLLADAFVDDPMIREVANRASSPAKARQYIFDASARSALRQGGVVLVASHESMIVGAAIMATPEQRRGRATAQRIVSGFQFLRLLPLLGWRGLALLNNADKASRHAAPTAPHHTLIAVGVSSTSQGRGYGHALVDAAFTRAKADPRSDGMRLETENPANVALYTRWGFHMLALVDVDPITVHVMYRSANTTQMEEPQ